LGSRHERAKDHADDRDLAGNESIVAGQLIVGPFHLVQPVNDGGAEPAAGRPAHRRGLHLVPNRRIK
jgi:hypothetical protein